MKAQPNLGSPSLWRPAVRDAVAPITPFDVALGDVNWFGDDIVFLDISGEIARLHHVVLAAVETVAQGDRFEYEGETYVPHLTLGATFMGDTPEELHRIAEAASSATWPAFPVREVVELRRQRQDEDYRPVASYPLGAT